MVIFCRKIIAPTMAVPPAATTKTQIRRVSFTSIPLDTAASSLSRMAVSARPQRLRSRTTMSPRDEDHHGEKIQ